MKYSIYYCFLFFSLITKIYSIEQWMYIYHPTLKNNSIIKKIFSYNTISITGFYLNEKGDLIIKTSLETIKKNTNKIYPLISLVNVSQGKKFLNNYAARKSGIKNILQLFEKESLYGIHIDFEYLTKKETKYFQKFLEELQTELHKRNKILTAALYPQIWEMDYKDFHNLNILAPYIDEVVIMTYDYHNPKTKPGPVSEYHWAEANLKEFLKFFRNHQLWLGIPLYGYEWSNTTKIVDSHFFEKINHLNIKIKKKIIKDINYGIQIEYIENDITKILYYPDEDFRNLLKELAKQYKLKGVAYWRLGF